MALDAVVEFVVRTVGPLIFELVFVPVFYWPGWLVLRVVTLGRHPPVGGRKDRRELVAVIGLAALLPGVSVCFAGGSS